MYDIVHRNHCMGITIIVLNGKIHVWIKVTTLFRVYSLRNTAKVLDLTDKF